jgi:hypothetical protein
MKRITICLLLSMAAFAINLSTKLSGSQTPGVQTSGILDLDAQTREPIAQMASVACTNYRKGCEDARNRCYQWACTGNGGQGNAGSCKGAANPGYSNSIKACSDQYGSCLNQCNGVCKRRANFTRVLGRVRSWFSYLAVC